MDAARRLAVFGLRGTIAMSAGGRGGVVPSLSAEQLIDAVPGLAGTGTGVEVEDFRRLPGASLSIPDITSLAEAIRARFTDGVDGVVVSQGTDTIPLPASERLPSVGMVNVTFGDEGALLFGVADRIDGLAGAGFGVGHVPERLVPVLAELAFRIPVVLASRTGAGPVLSATYAFPGSEQDLRKRGLISAGLLDPFRPGSCCMPCWPSAPTGPPSSPGSAQPAATPNLTPGPTSLPQEPTRRFDAHMRSHELTFGRSFGVAFDHGDDFFTALTDFCHANNVRQGYIPMFIAGFSEAEIVGTCSRLEDPRAPVWSKVYLTNIEALGGGTLAYDATEDRILPHIHVTVGLKEHSAAGHTSHLLSARVQFLTEMLLIEVSAPAMRRRPNPELYNVPLLQFSADNQEQ